MTGERQGGGQGGGRGIIEEVMEGQKLTRWQSRKGLSRVACDRMHSRGRVHVAPTRAAAGCGEITGPFTPRGRTLEYVARQSYYNFLNWINNIRLSRAMMFKCSQASESSH